MSWASKPYDLPEAAMTAMSPLPSGYVRLLKRLAAVCEGDPRVRAIWLGGSLGRRAADAGSDLDVLLAVADVEFVGFTAGWRDWLASVTPTIIARELPGLPGSFYSVTTDCERLDVVVEPVSELERTPYRQRVVVLDREGLEARLPPVATPSADPDRSRLEAIVEEFFREQAIFPAAVVAREDWLLGVVAVTLTQRMLYDIFVEVNQPLPPMGIKQWSARLTSQQRAILMALPPPAANREQTIQAMLAVRQAIRVDGRRAVESVGVSWPQALDDAVAAFYQRELGESHDSASPSASASASASALSTSPTTRIANPLE